MGIVRHFFHRLGESDEERLGEEIRAWAGGIPGTTPIAEAPLRTHVKLAGVVRRITVYPAAGHESLEALLFDGSGEVAVVWMGRRSIPGLNLGTRVIVDGVVGEQRAARKMVNPRFEFAA